MTAMRTVDAAEFRDALKPTVEGLRAFASAVDDLEQRSRPPAAESRAMSEIAAEQALSERSDWNDPLSVTHSNGALTLRAAADYVRGFAQVFTGDERMPMWAHLVLARAALEASVISAWLNEPGVEPSERMKRGLVEQLYSAREVQRLKLPGSMPKEEWWLKVAADFGWTVTWPNRKPAVDGTQRPSIPAGISRLIVDDEEKKIGRALWSRLSAVTHVSWWGVNWAFMHPGGEADAAGFVTVEIGTDQVAVAQQAFCILRALQTAAKLRAILMGFHRDERWQQACNDADQLAVALLRMKPPEPARGASPARGVA
jgi:hypothetical protein